MWQTSIVLDCYIYIYIIYYILYEDVEDVYPRIDPPWRVKRTRGMPRSERSERSELSTGATMPTMGGRAWKPKGFLPMHSDACGCMMHLMHGDSWMKPIIESEHTAWNRISCKNRDTMGKMVSGITGIGSTRRLESVVQIWSPNYKDPEVAVILSQLFWIHHSKPFCVDMWMRMKLQRWDLSASSVLPIKLSLMVMVHTWSTYGSFKLWIVSLQFWNDLEVFEFAST